jgi:hypothetical protein
MDNQKLNKEVFDWKQSRLEEGKFPCICGHFESSHVKRMCIACHGNDTGEFTTNCFHPFKQMDNLTIVEWIAAHKEGKEWHWDF